MDEINVAVLVEAKTEYTTQLVELLVPYIYEGITSIYEDGSQMKPESPLYQFQELLKEIPLWTQELVATEADRIRRRAACDWVDSLLEAVFVANTRILTAVRNTPHPESVNLTVPSFERFLHKCYIESAREFYKNPFLMDRSVGSMEQQRNMRESLLVIGNSVRSAVRKLLPFQDILRKYLKKYRGADDEEEWPEPASPAQTPEDEPTDDTVPVELVGEVEEPVSQEPVLPTDHSDEVAEEDRAIVAGDSAVSDVPEAPEVSDVPEAPEVSDVPEVSVVPAKPDVEEVIEIPLEIHESPLPGSEADSELSPEPVPEPVPEPEEDSHTVIDDEPSEEEQIKTILLDPAVVRPRGSRGKISAPSTPAKTEEPKKRDYIRRVNKKQMNDMYNFFTATPPSTKAETEYESEVSY